MGSLLNLLWINLVVTLTCLLFACQNPESQTTYEIKVREQAAEFFKTFAARSDWEKFCSYYREDVKFQDIILQLDLDSLWQLKRFYRWDEEGERFEKLSAEQEHLDVEVLVVDNNMAVARGHLNPFYYDGNLIDTDWGMEFTIWLYFDDKLNIIRQIDWFEYDSYTLESTIERCRKNGFKTVPEWLDLSTR